MRKNQLEAWVYRILERVESRKSLEDNQVELKRDWIEPEKAARQIGAHANVSRGEPILWIIGADEKKGAVVGASNLEFSNWHCQFKSCFDEGIAPELLHHLNIPWGSTVVAALLFETERTPYVVKNPSGGHITFEVPWRTATDTFSANRSQLLRILAPLQRLPDLEVMNGWLVTRPPVGEIGAAAARENALEWVIEIEFYIVPPSQQILVIPAHACILAFEIPELIPKTFFPFQGFGVSGGALLQNDGNQLTAQGPGYFHLSSFLTYPTPSGFHDREAKVTVAMKPVGSELPVIVTIVMKPEPNPERALARWRFEKSDDLIA